jgi:hypothetical protein
LKEHGRALEQVHRRLTNRGGVLKGGKIQLLENVFDGISTVDATAMTDDLVCILSNRFSSMDPTAISAAVHAVAKAFERKTEAEGVSPVPTNTTEAPSPAPSEFRHTRLHV